MDPYEAIETSFLEAHSPAEEMMRSLASQLGIRSSSESEFPSILDPEIYSRAGYIGSSPNPAQEDISASFPTSPRYSTSSHPSSLHGDSHVNTSRYSQGSDQQRPAKSVNPRMSVSSISSSNQSLGFSSGIESSSTSNVPTAPSSALTSSPYQPENPFRRSTGSRSSTGSLYFTHTSRRSSGTDMRKDSTTSTLGAAGDLSPATLRSGSRSPTGRDRIQSVYELAPDYEDEDEEDEEEERVEQEQMIEPAAFLYVAAAMSISKMEKGRSTSRNGYPIISFT